MFKMLDKLFDRLFALAGAALFSQAPEFFHQYFQRLSGHLAESERMVKTLESLAMQAKKTLPGYIDKFITNQDQDIVNQGYAMQDILQRYQELHISVDSFQNAGIWSKPFILMGHFQKDIVYSTLSEFAPGISLSLEGGVYAFIGLVLGYSFYAVLRALIKAPFSKTVKSPA